MTAQGKRTVAPGDPEVYADVVEFFPYTIDAFYALPEQTQAMLFIQAARLRSRREASFARAAFLAFQYARPVKKDGTYANTLAELAERYPEME